MYVDFSKWLYKNAKYPEHCQNLATLKQNAMFCCTLFVFTPHPEMWFAIHKMKYHSKSTLGDYVCIIQNGPSKQSICIVRTNPENELHIQKTNCGIFFQLTHHEENVM